MLKFAPTNEQEVIYLFAYVTSELGITVKRLQSEFPDAILIDSTGKELRAEFEYRTSNFLLHDHPPDKCDMVICWFDDCYLPEGIQVIALENRFPNLPPSPLISEDDAKANKTAIGLALIKTGRANKDELIKLFKMYHPKEQSKEPIRFIARLISNGGTPYVRDGILKLRNELRQSDLRYSVKDEDKARIEACRLLAEIGFNVDKNALEKIDLDEEEVF